MFGIECTGKGLAFWNNVLGTDKSVWGQYIRDRFTADFFNLTPEVSNTPARSGHLDVTLLTYHLSFIFQCACNQIDLLHIQKRHCEIVVKCFALVTL